MDDLMVRVVGACGRLTLNRPRAMNALSLGMVDAMADALKAWAMDDGVKFVLLDGAGERGLCAGGDVRAMYDAVATGEADRAAIFFRNEYRLNDQIARYPKPYVALMEGIVMGGGIGVSAHGSHRVVTERSQLAMPETAIGFIPDVGGSYLLSRAPGEFGTWLGLLGARIGAADAMRCGLADTMVPSASLPALTEQLEGCAEAAAMEGALHSFAMAAPSGVDAEQMAWIDACFGADTVEEIVAALGQHAAAGAQGCVAELGRMSPTSLKLTLAALRNGRALGRLAPCLEQEYRVAQACMVRHDFREGVRAALVDKDRNPRWSPGRLEEVTATVVEEYFGPQRMDDLGLGE